MEDLLRVETVEIVLNRGVHNPVSENHLIAHGFSGRHNPIGFAIDRLESTIRRLPSGSCSYSSGAFNLCRYLLIPEIQTMLKCSGSDAFDLADYGLRHFIDKLCPLCRGTGVINIEQEQCQLCNGTAEKKYSEQVKSVLSLIRYYQEWMENQINSRLKY